MLRLRLGNTNCGIGNTRCQVEVQSNPPPVPLLRTGGGHIQADPTMNNIYGEGVVCLRSVSSKQKNRDAHLSAAPSPFRQNIGSRFHDGNPPNTGSAIFPSGLHVDMSKPGNLVGFLLTPPNRPPARRSLPSPATRRKQTWGPNPSKRKKRAGGIHCRKLEATY